VPTIPLPDSVSAQTGVVALSAAKASRSANTMRLVITSPPISDWDARVTRGGSIKIP